MLLFLVIYGDLVICLWGFDVMLDRNMIHGCIFWPELICFLGFIVVLNLLGQICWAEMYMGCAWNVYGLGCYVFIWAEIAAQF